MAHTEWDKWFLLFVDEKKVAAANLLADQWDPDTGGAQTFGTVKLSPDGELPITHYACSTAATATMRDGITQALSLLSWAYMYWTNDIYPDSGDVQWQGPDGWTFDGPHGDIYPAWLAALDAMGLVRIQEDPLLVSTPATGRAKPARLRDALGRFMKVGG